MQNIIGSEVSQETNTACSQPQVEAKKTDVKEEREEVTKRFESAGEVKGEDEGMLDGDY